MEINGSKHFRVKGRYLDFNRKIIREAIEWI